MKARLAGLWVRGLRYDGRPVRRHWQIGKITVTPGLQVDDWFGILQAPCFEHVDDCPPAAFEDIDFIEINGVANRIGAQAVEKMINLPQRPPQIVGFHEHASLSYPRKKGRAMVRFYGLAGATKIRDCA